MNSQVRPSTNFRRLMLAVLSSTLLTAVIFGFSGINANAATVSSDSNQCQFTVGDSTGVTSTLTGGKCLVKFTSVRSTTWTAPQGVTSFDVLVVAGGGGGGADGGSGGGSGSLVETSVSLNGNLTPSFNIAVGGGGNAAIHTHGATNSTSGGSSQIYNSSLGFSLTTYGGGGGAWAASTSVSGGSGGSLPAVNAGSLTLASTNRQAGKAGASADSYNSNGSGYNGQAGVTSNLFGGTYIGSGGSGARVENSTHVGGTGGSGGGGRGSGGYRAGSYSNYGYSVQYLAVAGVSNSGGGGGAGARNATTDYITDVDGYSGYSRNGAAGGSGIVVLAYTPPDISVVTSGNGARISADLITQPVLQLRNSADQSLSQSGVTVTVATSSGAISGNTAISDSSGRVNFTNLQFTSGTVGTTVTLTFSAPGYQNATQTIKIQTLPTGITVSSSANSNGNFVKGIWLADTLAVSTVNASSLSTELTSFDVTLEAKGSNPTYITFSSPTTYTGASERTLTSKSDVNITVNAAGSISSTNGPLNLVFWTESDSVNGGSFRLYGGPSAFTLSTAGGHVAIGGGSQSTTWNGLTIPIAYSEGYSAGTGGWWGVELYGSDGNPKQIQTNGGDVRIFGKGRASTRVTDIYGIHMRGGQIDAGSGSVEMNGLTSGSPSNGTGPNVGVAIINIASTSPSITASGGISITGASDTSGDYNSVRIGDATLNSGSAGTTITGSSSIGLLAGNTWSSSATITTTTNVAVTGAQTAAANLTINCPTGAFTNSPGAIDVTGDLSVNCRDITTSAALTAGGNLTLDNSTTTGTTAININANLNVDSAGGSILVKSKSDIITGNSVTMQTAGRSSGTGGNLVLWSDADASGEGYIQIGRNPVFNSVGGSTSTFSGGGDIHLGGGLDNGAATVVAGRAAGDGVPDGWAISSTTMGIWIGNGAISGDLIKMHSGGGDISLFGKSSGGSDALAFNWTTQVDSGEGQIEIHGDSGGWGVQLNRGGFNDTFAVKSTFTSRSDLHPAIYIRGKSSGNSGTMALLGSYGDAGTDNLLIQAAGDGGIDLIADGPANDPALGLQSTSVLSKSGTITLDGGTSSSTTSGGIRLGSVYSGAAQGSVRIGECPVLTCANSLVTVSTADVNIISNRITSHASLSTTVDTAGTLTITPAVGSTAFSEFQYKTDGLSLDPQLGGLVIGRSGDTTSPMEIQNSWTVTGPITVHANVIHVRSDMRTTGSGNSPIRLLSRNQIYTNPNTDLITNGSDVVFWSGLDKVAGTVKPASTIYIDTSSTITTNGGKIWLAGGLDDGGADASITANRGKWSSVVAGDGLPDGYAMGENSSNTWATGVVLAGNTRLLSGGGDIFIAGSQGPTSQDGWGSIFAYPGAQIDSGNGRIAMWGKSYGGNITNGIALNYGDNGNSVMVTSNAPTSDAITIYSDSSSGSGYSRGIIATWFGALSASRNYQGTQILATASGGGITMTGIGSASSTSNDPHGLYIDFTDIMAVDGPISINGDSPTWNGSAGVAFGWRDNVSNIVRLGGWVQGSTSAVGGGVITTPGGVTADFTASSADITINTDSFWNRHSTNGFLGLNVATTGDFKILPTQLSSGLIQPADNFKTTQNTLDWSFEELLFPLTVESIQIGRPTTTTAIKVSSNLTAAGDIAVYGSALDIQGNLISSQARGQILVKSTSSIALAASKTYQTNGRDLVLWAGSAGGSGNISVGNSACINTNASCDPAVSVATGNIIMGGGAAGTLSPTGPASSTSTHGILFGTSEPSNIKIYSGGGNAEIRGSTNSTNYGVVFYSGFNLKATTGGITISGSTTGAGRQGVRIANVGTSSISSGKTAGDAIVITGSNSSGSTTAESNGIALGLLSGVVNITASGGGDIRLNSTVTSSGEIQATQLNNTTVTATGGDILFAGDWAELDASRLDASDGGSIQIKSTRHIVLTASTIETSGPGQGSGGEIAIWSDSDGDDVGRIRTSGTLCLNTIGSCSAPTATGGASIYLGGGSTADETGFYPLGGAPAGTTDYVHGIQFSNGYGTDVTKIWSGGGDISIASKTRTTGATNHTNSGQFWHGGTNVNSGNGQIRITNYSGGATTRANYGIRLNTETGSSIITSSKPTGEAIRIVSSLGNSGDVSQPIWLADGSSTVRNVISATGGGDIYLEGNASGTGSGTYSIDASNADILASTGNITLKGNRGVVWNRDASGLTNVGAISGGSATGNIVVEGNRFVTTSTWPLNFRTTGTLTVKPLAGEDFLATTTFPASGITLTGLSGLTVGAPLNDADLTVGVAASVAGPITYEGGAFTGSGALTNTGSGEITILSSSTVALNANLSSGAGGILVKSVGRITGGSGTSAVAPRSFTTASGPITFWTTGSTGGIKVGNFTTLDTTISGTGADITLGGGLADSEDPNRPSGPSEDSGADGVLLGSGTPATDVVVLRAGSGNVSISGENTSTSAYSGIEVVPGLDIEANKIVMRGVTGYNSTSNTAAGINFYYNGYANQISLHATGGFDTKSTAIDIYSESASVFAALLGSNPDATDAVVMKASGNNAGISIVGQSSYPSAEALWLAAFTLETRDGDVSIDTGSKALRLGSSTTRIFTYRPTTGNAGGDLNIRTAEIKTAGTGNISTAGTVAFVPYGTSFASPQTFPAASSTIDVGGLVVGSETNTANLTQGSAITSSGDVQYLGGAQIANYGITTSNSADIEFRPTTTFSKSTNVFDASGDILIGKTTSPATTVTMSTGQLTAGGSVKVYSSGALTQSAQVTAGNRVDLVSTTSDVLVNKGVSAGSGGIHFKASRDILLDAAAKNITTTAGDIIFWANASGNGGEVDTGSLDVIVDSNGGDIVIAGGADDGANGGAALDEIPDNYLLGRTLDFTARLEGSLLSDAGDVTIRSKHSAYTGTRALAAFYLAPSAVISATSGDIRLYGIQNSGNTSTSNQYGLWLGSSTSAASKAVISSDSGDVYLSGDSSQSVRSNRRGIILYGVDVSAGRDLTLLGNAPTGQSGIADVLAWVPSTLTATRNTLIQGPNTSYLEYMSIDSGASLKFEVGNLIGTNGLSATVTHTPLAITGTGSVVIEPHATSFISALSLQDVDFASTISGLRVGKTGNTADLTIAGTNKEIAGPIELIGGNVNLNSGLTTTSGSISVKGTGNIIGSEGTTLTPRLITTSGGDITLHSDSDANGGYIHIKNFTTISTGSGTGDILISGGLDPLTGFASTDSSSGINTAGVNLVTSVDATVYGNGVVISAGTGDVNIRGKASGNNQGRGIHLPRSSSDANKSSISGANVALTGKAEGSGTWYGIEFGRSSSQTSTVTTKTLMRATETLSLEGSSVNYDGITATYVELDANEISITGTGPRQPVRLSATQTVVTAGDGGVIMTASKSGTPTTDSVTFAPTSFTSSGPVEISFDRSSSSGQLVIPSTTTISTTDANVTLESDALEISGAISAGTGIVTISPATVGKVITAGAEVSNTLSLTSTELGKITAGTLRLTTEGDVNVTSSLNFTNKITNFAIRSGGNVTGSAGVVITVANLGINATGNISFPGNQVATVIALSGAAITYNQSADYSVASVDDIAPQFGFGVKFAIADVPTIAAQDAFMNVAFNPPPVVTILDKFNNVLATNNLSVADFTVTPTLNSVSSSGTPVLAGETPTLSGGEFTFDAINVSGGTGTHTLTFSVTTGTAPSTTNLPLNNNDVFTDQQVTTYTTGTYNVQAGEPASISIAYTSISSQAGETGFGLTATLKDTSGNTIATGPHATATISVSIAGTNGTIVSGDSPTTAAGVADFSDLILGGSVETDYTLTFSVTYTDTQSEPQTVTETQVVTLTPGDATKLDVTPATQTQATGQVLSDITVSILDAYDNIVTSSTDAISIAMSAGSNGGSATLVGYTTPVAATNGQVVFNTLGINGTEGNYTLTFSSGSLTTDTHVATITHSVAHHLGLSIPATAKNDVALSTDPIVTVYDVYDNIVESFVGDITLSVDSGSLSGTVSMDAVAGIADFDGKGVKLLGLSGTKAVTATAASLSNMNTSENVSLMFGPAVALDLTTSAAGFVNRVNFSTQPIVTVEDSSGNPVEDFVGDVEVAVSGTNIELDGTKTITLVDADNGVAEFSGLSLRGEVGNYTLSFTSTDLSSDSQSASLTHGVATQVELSAPGTITNDTLFSPQPSVRILDADDNLVDTGSDADQSVVLTSDATLTGTTTITTENGIATYAGLKLTGTFGSKTLTATISSPSTITGTANTTIEFGAATKLAITTLAAGFVNRTNFSTQPVVTVQDVSGNTVTDFAGDIELQIGTGAIITGTRTLTLTSAEQGVANFSGLGLQGTVGDYTITAQSTGLADATQSLTLTHGAPTKITIIQSAAGIRSGQVFDTPIALEIQDADGNVTDTGLGATAQIEVTKQEASFLLGGADFGGTLTVTASAGVATFGDLKLSGAVGDYNLSFAVSSPLELSGFTAATETVTLAAGSKSTISIVEQPVDAEAGVAFSPVVTVEILDAWGNRVLADSSSTISALRVDPTNVSVFETLQTETVASGLATFTGINVETIGDFKIRFTSASVDPVLSNQFTVRHGPASKLVFTTNPISARSDVAFTSVLRLLDQYDNAVTTGPEFTISASVVSANNGDVLSLTGNETTSSPGTEILIYSQMKLKAPTGTYQLRYTATDGTDSFSIDSNNIVLGYGNPAQLNIATEAATALAGEAFGTQPIIEIQDSAGNLVANSSLLVTASVPGKSLVGTEGVAALGGIANFSSSGLGIAGTVDEDLSVEYSIEYPAGNFITASHTIDLLAGPTRYIHILEQPTELVTRGTFSPGVEIQLRDQYQNPVLSDSTTSVSALLYGANDAVATATVGEPAIQAISAAAVSGVVDFSSLSYAVAPANGYYLKFSLPSNFDVVDSSTFTVVPGAVASISIDQQPSTTNFDNSLVKTGELLAAMPEVSLYDQDGYLADNASGSVAVSISSGNGGDLSEGITTATINSGRAVFSGVKLVGTPLQGSVAAEQYALKFSFNGVDSASSDLLSVTHNVASKLILQRGASGGRAGEPFTQQPIIEVQDRYSNIVENSNAQIRAGASAGARITSGREVNAQSGIATFTSLGLGGLTTGTYQLTFEIPNTAVTNVAQSNITLTYGFADHLGITTAPASLDSNGDLTKTGSLLAVQPVVKVYDADNNVVESSNDIITVSYVSTFDDRDRLEGETLQAVNGVVAFQDLKLIARPGQNYTLNFTSGELGNTQSETLQVRHADPDSIEITTQPSAVIDSVNGILTRTGNALAVQPQIRILDFDGNHADSATGVNVVATVVSGGGTAVVALDANGRAFNEAVITAGAAAFSELKLVATPGVAQEIAFSAAFPAGTISSVSSDQLTLTNGLAQSLAMHVEPCAGADDGVTCTPGVTGEALEVQPAVKVLDAYGNLVVDHVGDVVAAVTATGARLSVADSDDVTLRTIAVAGGYANFSGLELTATPGTPVSIGFSSQGLAGVSSRDLVVGSAGASRIEMVVQPIGERTGNEFSTQPTIKLVDRFGNTVTSDSASVITVSASGGNLFLDPEAPLAAVANQGIVSFTGLRFTGTPGDAYQLTFAGAGLTPATSADFSVTNAFANNLVITQQPASGKTGDLLSQMPVLELRDFDGNLAEDDNDTVVVVTIDVSNGSASFVDEQDQNLVTAPSATASAGVVEIEGLRIVATPGTVYKLNFEATPLVGGSFSSSPSGELVFTHANPAQLVVTQSSLGGLAGEDLPTQPIIEVQDRFGNRATGDSATVVTATIETGTSGDVLRGASVSAVDGVVSFTELAIDGVPDQTYTLRYSAVSGFGDGFSIVDSDELTLSRPAALTLSMGAISFAPDQVVAPVFTNDSQGVVTWTTTTDATICVLELDGNNDPTGNVIVKGVGTCSLKAEVARFDFTHLAAPQSSYLANEISANLVINKAAQASLSMTSADNVNYRGSLTLASSGGSGTGAISYRVSGDCRAIGGVLLPGEAGASCIVFARKAGDANYEQADSADQTIAINRIAQSPLYIGNARDVAVGDITLFTSGGTGNGEVSYQVSTVGSAACEILDGNILRATQNGTCGVMATKQSSTNYLVAISPEVTFSFSKMTQVVNFTSIVPSRPLPGTLFTPTAVASSELAVSISISAGEGTVCEFDSVENSSIRFLTSGNCVLTATQSGSDRFTAASSSLTIAVNAMNQTITFPSLTNKVFGEPKFQLGATASSGLPVSYALGSTFQNPGCSVTSAGMVTLTASGMCEIIASQPGDTSYLAAPYVVQIFSVAPDLAGAPHLVSVAVSNQAITAKFRAPSYLGGSQVSAYRLEASNGAGDTYVNPGCSAAGTDLVCDLVGMPLTRQVDGETVAISYTVRVAAVTAAGIGVYSDSSPSVIPRSTDFAVMQLSGDQIDGQLEVTWAEPLAFDGEFVSYEVYVWPLNTAEPDEPTQTITSVTTESASFEMEDAQPTISSFGFSAFTQNISIPSAAAYNLKVVTVTDTLSDDLDDINVASGVQIGLGAPGRPRNEVIEADSQQLKIFWSQPNSDGGSEVTHYMIRKLGEAAAPCEAIDPSSALASGVVDESWNYSLNQPSALLYEQSGLTAGSSYEIAVFACNEIGASQPAILTHSIPAPPAPAAPLVPEEEVDVEEENPKESEENGSESEEPTAPSENETPGPVSPDAQEPGDPDPETTDPESPEKPDAAGETPAGGLGSLTLLLWVFALMVLLILLRFIKRKRVKRDA